MHKNHTESRKKKETEEYVPNKRKRIQGKKLNETAIRDLPDKELKIMVKKMLTKFRRILYEESKNFNRGRKYKKILNRNHDAKKYTN